MHSNKIERSILRRLKIIQDLIAEPNLHKKTILQKQCNKNFKSPFKSKLKSQSKKLVYSECFLIKIKTKIKEMIYQKVDKRYLSFIQNSSS